MSFEQIATTFLLSYASIVFAFDAVGCLRFGSDTLGKEPPLNEPKPGARLTGVEVIYKNSYKIDELYNMVVKTVKINN